jgi:hypothetical protein
MLSSTIYSSPRLLQVKTVDHAALLRNSFCPPRSYSRGAIIGFSQKAKLNLARYLSRLNVPSNALHLSCTYGASFPKTSDSFKHDLAVFKKRVIRLGLYGVWRLEFQKRGAPHYHFLLWPVDGESYFLGDAAAESWRKVSGNNSDSAAYVSGGAIGRSAWYLALHSAKGDQSPPIKVGRWWGKISSEELNDREQSDPVASLDSQKEMILLKRIFVRHLYAQKRKLARNHGNGKPRRPLARKWSSNSNAGFTWFLPEASHSKLLKFVAEFKVKTK